MNTPSFSRQPERTAHSSDQPFELLLFRLGTSISNNTRELFGINVFKVREIVVKPQITGIVNAPPSMLGLANIRGQLIPTIDLPGIAGCKPQSGTGVVLVTEFARTTQAFLVDGVVEIVRMEWKHLLAADSSGGTLVSGIARIDGDAPDSRLAQVLDVEQILRNVFPREENDDAAHANLPKVSLPPDSVMLFADDSAVARMMIEKGLQTMGLRYTVAKNGKDAWNQLEALHTQAMAKGKVAKDLIALVLTDLEMPEMDGFALTKAIKQDPRFSGIPVIVHSSLTGTATEGHARSVGADAYVAKFEPQELGRAIHQVLTRG